jgi:hypothetical protein
MILRKASNTFNNTSDAPPLQLDELDDVQEDVVEVLGVLRVARVLPGGAFSGSDVCAVSAFCGQIALCLRALHCCSTVR